MMLVIYDATDKQDAEQMGSCADGCSFQGWFAGAHRAANGNGGIWTALFVALDEPSRDLLISHIAKQWNRAPHRVLGRSVHYA